jgi:PAS domain S-box-containing protein
VCSLGLTALAAMEAGDMGRSEDRTPDTTRSTSDARLLAGLDAALGELVRLCDQHGDELSHSAERALHSHPSISAAWRGLVSSAGWPSRTRLKQCVDSTGVGLIGPVVELLRDCGRSSSRAHLRLEEFTEGVQLVVDEITRLVVSIHQGNAQKLSQLLSALQRCASVMCLIMSRESLAEGEHTFAHGQIQLVQAEAKFASLWESGLLGVLVCDFHGNIREANDGFLQTFGFTREALVAGQVRWNEMTPPEWRHLDEHAIAQLNATGRAQPWEKEYFHRDGTRIPVIVGVSVLNSEETIAFVLDVTERRYVQALRERSLELEAENRRVHEASRLKGEFLANMSHELRTPLTAITGFAELLLNGDVTPDSPEHGEFLQDILSAGVHLQRVISEVLDLAKIEAGSLQFHP